MLEISAMITNAMKSFTTSDTEEAVLILNILRSSVEKAPISFIEAMINGKTNELPPWNLS
jgi:hypothetical protein